MDKVKGIVSESDYVEMSKDFTAWASSRGKSCSYKITEEAAGAASFSLFFWAENTFCVDKS